MDDDRFDDLTRALVDQASRRHLLRLLGGSALGGLLARLGPEEAAADHGCRHAGTTCKKHSHCCSRLCKKRNGKRKGRCLCTSSEQCPQPVKPCQVAACVGGRCGTALAAAGTACDDGDPCTGDGTCGADGSCQPGAPKDCTSGNPCVVGTCDATSGACSQTNKPNGSWCSGGQCLDGRCNPPPTCRRAGAECTFDSQCCSNSCPEKVFAYDRCTCSPSGRPCLASSDCCSGLTCVAYECRG